MKNQFLLCIALFISVVLSAKTIDLNLAQAVASHFISQSGGMIPGSKKVNSLMLAY